MYVNQEMRTGEIAKLYNCWNTTVANHLKEWGFDLNKERHNAIYKVDTHFFDEIDSLDEKKLVYFLGQEFYKDYKKGETSKFREKISVPATTLSGLSDIELANLYAKILKGDKPSINNQQEKNQALAEIAEGIRNGIRKLLRSVLEDRYKLYYGEGYIESKDARMVIRGTCTNIMSYRNLSLDERQFSEAFDYLGLECETFHLEPKEIKLVRGRKNDKKNGIINMAIDEDDGIMNLQILKILCKKLSVFCAKDENDQKLYLFPYPWDDDLKKCDVGSICDVSDKGIEHISYHYDYEGDSGEDKYAIEDALQKEWDISNSSSEIGAIECNVFSVKVDKVDGNTIYVSYSLKSKYASGDQHIVNLKEAKLIKDKRGNYKVESTGY